MPNLRLNKLKIELDFCYRLKVSSSCASFWVGNLFLVLKLISWNPEFCHKKAKLQSILYKKNNPARLL